MMFAPAAGFNSETHFHKRNSSKLIADLPVIDLPTVEMFVRHLRYRFFRSYEAIMAS